MTFSSDVLAVERDGHVATVWLDRPEARNAMGPALWADLPRAMADLSADRQVRAVVVAARGPHFSVGLDLKSMGALLSGDDVGGGAPAGGGGDPPGGGEGGDPPGGGRGGGSTATPSQAARARATRATVLRLQAAVTSVAACPKPVVAAVHGYCIGGGVDLVAACDIRLASADAVFSVREAKVAIVADLGSLQRLPQIIGSGHLAELAFTGKDIDADRALRIGLVNDVFADHDAVVAAARALAAEIAANSPVAVQGTKAVLAANDGRTVAEGLDYVATWNAGMLSSDDLVEAMTAFLEKRPPRFTGN
ncbi:MAG TPA: enoyl-CoA hydratase-related protein [Acidimicrobiales bacterium]|nr:enoyl-CoA hydratase-related protein [Acidimicrobiales bacterium]